MVSRLSVRLCVTLVYPNRIVLNFLKVTVRNLAVV